MAKKNLSNLISNYLDTSRNIVKSTKKVFYFAKEAQRCISDLEKRTLPENLLKKSEKDLPILLGVTNGHLLKLFEYEITYDTFEKSLEDAELLSVIKRAYEFDTALFDRKKWASAYRFLIPNATVSKRTAKKHFDEYVKAASSDFGFLAKALFGKQIKASAEEVVYKYRDWALTEFEEIIDYIEPFRHQYIIKKMGEVDPKEVDQYLDSIIKTHETLSNTIKNYDNYEFFLTSRLSADFMYYPDMKF